MAFLLARYREKDSVMEYASHASALFMVVSCGSAQLRRYIHSKGLTRLGKLDMTHMHARQKQDAQGDALETRAARKRKDRHAAVIITAF